MQSDKTVEPSIVTPTPLPNEQGVPSLAAWLRESGLALPAWMALECARPFGWLLGQACLVAQPLAHGLGWGNTLDTAVDLFQNPEGLNALSEALAPGRESS